MTVLFRDGSAIHHDGKECSTSERENCIFIHECKCDLGGILYKVGLRWNVFPSFFFQLRLYFILGQGIRLSVD